MTGLAGVPLAKLVQAALQTGAEGHDGVVTGEPFGQAARLDLVVQLGEGDAIVQAVVGGQEVDEVGQRVGECFCTALGSDRHDRVEPGTVSREGG